MTVNSWLQTLAQLQQQAISCVLVTVASTVGSTPREVGSKMIVTAANLFGTIGGGNLEHQACKIAREQLNNPQPYQLKRFPLGAGLGQCCGGLVNLLFEPLLFDQTLRSANNWISLALDYERSNRAWVRVISLYEADAPVTIRNCVATDKTGLVDKTCFIEVNRTNNIELALFGAGHVGRAVVNALQELPVQIRWIDSRENEFPLTIPINVELVNTDTPEAEVDAAGNGAYFLVMTHEHRLDQVLSEAILKRNDFTYFGLIGSQSKRRLFETRLHRRGINTTSLQRMTCPIGIKGIDGKQPAMIGLSVAAQIMQVYHSNSSAYKQASNA